MMMGEPGIQKPVEWRPCFWGRLNITRNCNNRQQGAEVEERSGKTHACRKPASKPMRSIHDMTTLEAYELVRGHFGHELPPLDAIENEDWGRDYVLQKLIEHSAEELARVGLLVETDKA